jgi:myosin protein heavy chain
LAESEKALAEAITAQKAADNKLQAMQERIHELETHLEEEGRESSHMDLLQQRLAEEMEDERKQHQQDIEERDFNLNQTQKKYQGTCFVKATVPLDVDIPKAQLHELTEGMLLRI